MDIIQYYFLPNLTALKLCNQKYKYVAKFYIVYFQIKILYSIFSNQTFFFRYSFNTVEFGNKYYLMISILIV